MNSVYHKLRERLDTYSLGFPATESGIEIKILKKLFSEEHAGIFLNLSQKLEEVGPVSERTGIPADKLKEILEDMTLKGLIFRQISDGKTRYGAIAFMHGIAEFQVKRMDSELSNMMEQYFEEGLHKSTSEINGLFLRVIPVQKYVDVTHHIATYNDAKAILDKIDLIVATDCFCRVQKNAIDAGCGKPVETCLMFGTMGQYYLDQNMGRKIDKEEAYRIVIEAQKAGLVTQPGTSQNPSGMCSCCGDCCGVLSAIKKHPKPAEIVYSSNYATIDDEKCTGCGACIDICQMEAITVNDSGTSEVNLDRCIGCGLCLLACNFDAVVLNEKSDDKKRAIPETTKDQFIQMARKRGLI